MSASSCRHNTLNAKVSMVFSVNRTCGQCGQNSGLLKISITSTTATARHSSLPDPLRTRFASGSLPDSRMHVRVPAPWKRKTWQHKARVFPSGVGILPLHGVAQGVHKINPSTTALSSLPTDPSQRFDHGSYPSPECAS